MARPSKYESNVKDKFTLITGWVRNGLTDKQISNNLGVSYSTFREYVKKYPTLLALLKKSKEVTDMEVENALFKRALGYDYEETKVINEESEEGHKKRVEVTKKKMAPDTTAQIFWLKNRKPKEWRDRQNIEHSGGVEVSEMAALTTEELKALAKSKE